MQITPTQAAIIRHRLEVPDAIEEALGIYGSEIERVEQAIEDGLIDRFLNLDKADAINPELTTDVLVECIEGSTYIGAQFGVSVRRLSQLVNIVEDLAARIESERDCIVDTSSALV